MYIKKLIINNVRHLKNLEINIGEEKKHLILTGKNGSGKTSILESLNQAISNRKSSIASSSNYNDEYKYFISTVDKILLAEIGDPNKFNSKFIHSFFSDNRQLTIDHSNGPTKDFDIYKKVEVTKNLVQIMVNLKTKEAFALNEQNNEKAQQFKEKYLIIENNFKDILQDPNLILRFDYDNYDFNFIQGEKKFSIHNLPAGYASATMIVMNLLLKSDMEIHDTNRCGIVLIDEIETHLHISLQKKILPILTSVFPNIQFIVTTHSPFIITSLENAVVYDLENQITLDDLTSYSYQSIIEDYFDNNQYSEIIINKISRYDELTKKEESSELDKEELEEKYNLLKYFESLQGEEIVAKLSKIFLNNRSKK